MTGNLVIVGVALFLLVVVAFAMLRRINRLMIASLSASFILFGTSSVLSALSALASGSAPWPKGRYDLAAASLAQAPAAYWLSTAFLWALAVAFSSMGLYLLSIPLRRTRHGP